jgi:NAD(P)-dependent dehydrogenase (short-subunit alcohol dehydrogenase family)
MAESTNRLADKVAIVTGSGQGIGRAEAMLLAAEGAKVVVSDMGFDDGVGRAATVVAEIEANGGAGTACTADISTFDGAQELVRTAVDAFGGLDIVVNNAGLRANNTIQDMTEEQFDLVISSHLKSSFATIKFAAPIFIQQQSGVIVNTSSDAGFGHPFNIPYSCAKEGITALTRSVARELGPFGVRCNQIRPRSDVPKAPEFMAKLASFGPQYAALGRFRLGTRGDVFRPSMPENVAPLTVWLCTDAAAELNGYDFFVMGDLVGLWSEPDLVRSQFHEGGWTIDLLDEYALTGVAEGLHNRFLGDS